MTIKKLGHCCLLIKTDGKTVLTDPGAFSTAQNDVAGVDIVLITHEHQDHLHIDSLRKVLANNPQAVVVANASVGRLLDKENIKYQILEDGQKRQFDSLSVEGFGTIHAEIYKTLPRVQNTGFMIAGRLCYPGDAFEKPNQQPEIIALPVAGPWMKISEAVDYALELQPKSVFPVHDAILSPASSFVHTMMTNLLGGQGINYVKPDGEMEMEF